MDIKNRMILNRQQLGIRIKEARVEKQMSQRMLAGKIYVSRPYVSELEKGRAKIELEIFLKVCVALDKPMEFFL